jgi:hypothetical protein
MKRTMTDSLANEARLKRDMLCWRRESFQPIPALLLETEWSRRSARPARDAATNKVRNFQACLRHRSRRLVRVPCDKSRRKFLAKSKQWLSQHRHWKRRDQQKQLVMMLRGFYQYFGLHHCKSKLDGVRREVQRQWARTLRRRSQRHRLYWSYLLSQTWFELPYAVSTLHATV